MSEYSSSKIYKGVIIVENNQHQGYVVEKGNKKMLDSAHKWASGCILQSTMSIQMVILN